jgi:hypothetical protein
VTDALDDAPHVERSGSEILGRSGSAEPGPTLGILLPIFGLRDGTLHPDRIAGLACGRRSADPGRVDHHGPLPWASSWSVWLERVGDARFSRSG